MRIWSFRLTSKMRKRIKQFSQIFLVCVIFLIASGFIRPLRNRVFFFLIPGAWLELSTSRIIQLYDPEPAYPVTSTRVTCDSIQDTMKKGRWDRLEAEMENFPVYDENYLKNIRDNLEMYGISQAEYDQIERHPEFKPSLTASMQRELQLTLKVLVHAMELFNVTYFLNGGSMIGSFRHHGLVPWDDDLDVCLKVSDWLKAKQILKCIPNFDVYADNGLMYKFFYKKSPLWKGEKFIRFPFIDVFFLNEDQEYTWATSWFKKHTVFFKKSDIYPLSQRPFGDIVAAVPRNMESLLLTIYDAENTCVSKDFDHFSKLIIYFFRQISCQKLHGVYPFIKRVKSSEKGKDVVTEYRMIGKKVLSEFTVY